MRKLVLGLLIASACSSSFEPAFDGTLFLAQKKDPNAFMDALFDGVVSVDDAGCYRLALADQVTMVWPAGYRLISTIEGPAIVNREGVEIGRVGGTFRIGGGVVPTIPEGSLQSESLRREALARCPGSFWIAAPDL
ncbi:MAG: hypothetical protein R2882_02075 [Gemmatimonadales bacterium]